MPFVIVSDSPSPSDTWRIDDDGLAEYLSSGQADLDRGLTFLAKGEPQTAAGFFWRPAEESCK